MSFLGAHVCLSFVLVMTSFFQSIHPVPEDILESYLAHWQEYALPRKAIITRQGQTERWMYLVLEGIQKSYYLKEGKEHIMAFTYPPSASGIPESFFTQTPARYFLETITESRFLRISYARHQELMEAYRPIETLFRKGTELLLKGVLERHYELMAFTIEERFKSFVQRSPHLLNQVPHKDLASYLRIDPTNFSKLLGSVSL